VVASLLGRVPGGVPALANALVLPRGALLCKVLPALRGRAVVRPRE
jgi:hypothetical protein